VITPSTDALVVPVFDKQKVLKTLVKTRKDLWNELRAKNEIPLQSDSPSTQTWMSVQK